ncbi:MAG: acetyl-CoA carboxylase carboxyltransferase subunit alpha [Eubacteriaceae bacterium]
MELTETKQQKPQSLKQSEAEIASLMSEQQKMEEGSRGWELLQESIVALRDSAYHSLTPWDKVYLARHPKRPKARDYIERLFPDFMELSGDRCYGEDKALLGGLATLEGNPVTILAQSKGRTTEENMECGFGMMHPEGYRKAMRLARQAEKFRRPVITLIDTAGAYPGKGAEERGQAQAIAECLKLFSGLRTPVVGIVLSEGGSGGALALSVTDRLAMLEHAVYSVLSPEGFASILWRDESRAEEAAGVMELTAQDLYRKGIIDTIIREPQGAHNNFYYVCEQMDQFLVRELKDLSRKRSSQLVDERWKRLRSLGGLER